VILHWRQIANALTEPGLVLGSRLVGGITPTATEIFLAERTLGGDCPGRFDGQNMAQAKTMYILSVMVSSRLAMSGIAHSLRSAFD
jgi:hypothetical protein